VGVNEEREGRDGAKQNNGLRSSSPGTVSIGTCPRPRNPVVDFPPERNVRVGARETRDANCHFGTGKRATVGRRASSFGDHAATTRSRKNRFKGGAANEGSLEINKKKEKKEASPDKERKNLVGTK